jgi:hypothetical protein
MSDDDFFRASEKEGRILGEDGLGDPDKMRQVFSRANPWQRVAMLGNIEKQLAGRTFERSETRAVAKLNRVRRELTERHRTLLRLGR